MRRVEFHDKYLGLPVLVRKSKKETFAYVKDRVWKKLQSWRGGLLSSAWREILVKTVAQALPMYSIQCFLLPKTFCEDLNMLIAKFWWSGDPGKRKIHRLNWRTLCKPKHEGGLRFRDFYAFNQALLAKQAWQFLHDPETLVYRVFKARYFPTTDFLEARVPSSSSYVWRSIAASRLVIRKGVRWQVGNWRNIRIWKDNWVPRESCFRILSPRPPYWDEEATVENLFPLNSKQWNYQMLNELFSPEEVDLICDIPLSIRDDEDRRVWHYELNGKFTVRSAYHVARELNEANEEGVIGYSSSSTSSMGVKFWKKLWNACVLGKVKICVWRACVDALPTRLNLCKRRVTTEEMCVVCGGLAESTEHVLRDCHMARAVWFRGLGVRVGGGQGKCFLNWLAKLQFNGSSPGFELGLMLA